MASYKRSRVLAGLIAVAVVAAVYGCGGGEGGAPVVVRDSAGVQIVENLRPAWPSESGWTLSEDPSLQIGVTDGPVEYQFTDIQGAVRLPGGGFVVADGGSHEIRFFDADGRFLTATGRRGDAPGEYRQIAGLGYGPGDSVWVYDFGTRRFTVLTTAGELVRTMNLGGALSAVGAVGRFSDGSFVVREYWSSGTHSGVVRSGLSRDPAAIATFSGDGAELDTVGVFPGREVYIGSEDGRAVMSAPLYARTASVALSGDEVYVGDQERFEVGLYTASGALRRLVRVLGIDLRVTQEDIDRAVAERLADQPPERHAMLRAHLDAMDVPETRPAYGRLLVDSESNLWVAEHTSYPVEPASGRVFDSGGGLLGVVRVPERFRVHQIGEDWILGVWRDEFGVEYVRLHALVKDGEAD
jgi:hypothetical protein